MSFLEGFSRDPRRLTFGFLVAGVLLAAWVYAPALTSDLYLDSAKLYQLERVYHEKAADVSLDDLSFTTGTGRPVSQASFYLNILSSDGLDAASVKLSNLVLHGVNALLVFVLAVELLGRTAVRERRHLLAGFVALAWLLSAVNIGSVVYAIQRMNQLAAFFSLLALLFYVRLRPDNGEEGPGAGRWLFIGIGVVVLTALAVGSKENGVLIPVFIVLIEFYFYPTLRGFLSRRRTALIVVPALVLVGALAVFWLTTTYWSDPDARSFSLGERLLTQCRILWTYIFQLLVPSSLATGIFQDGYPISAGLLSPLTTIASLLGVVALAASALWFRDSPTLGPVAFGLAFFLGGHLLESTVLPLELYYEHRNYLPSFGMYMALVAGGYALLAKLKPAMAAGIVVVYFAFFVAVAHAKAVTWSDRQLAYDAALARDYLSPRAAQGRAQLYLENGELEPALALLNALADNAPRDALLARLQILYVHCAAGMPADAELYARLGESTGRELPIELSQALQNVLGAYEQTSCPAIVPAELLPILMAIAEQLRETGRSAWHVDYYIAGFYALDDAALAARFLESRFLAGETFAGWMLRDMLQREPGIDVSVEAREAIAALPEDES